VTSAALAQGRAPTGTATASPAVTPSPGGRTGDRGRNPGFVVVLVLLGLGLLWQVQRTRRTTDRISRSSLDELERALRPEDETPPRE
jgi:hypothetical protein